ncbi:hypothetical protein GXB85_13615 [Cellulomonas sp. APG4]|uniref:hypothetical protein n=1 Tax=Cellulomonas sp. APG4 TaxID=1538656 RepID=UPI00137B3A3E|nr:hypothetical protein [Cellulomonas sp. APG4]NCT91980.1 hypothetical protein [Cellulomonas sp. APG4]
MTPQNIRSRLQRHAADDRGVTMVEVLVAAVILMPVLIGIGIGIYHFANSQYDFAGDREEVYTGLQSANSTIRRDVEDGVAIRVAEAQSLTVSVVRDGTCRLRAYEATGGELILTETFYDAESCSGGSRDTARTVVPNYTATETFTYFNADNKVIPTPVQDTRNIKRVAWALEGTPTDQQPIDLPSSAAFDGLGERAGTGTDDLQATAPLLSVITPVVGAGQPVLEWEDLTPTLTASWVVYRTMGPEGGTMSSPEPVALLDATVTTWTDNVGSARLPAGYTAVYSVRAGLRDGTPGPGSNAVVTGLRPSVVTGVVATGAPTSIEVTWAPVVGATGYDIYRDGELRGRVGAVTTWTDGRTSVTGRSGWGGADYGHSHAYRVVAVNRWEQKFAAGDEGLNLPWGAAVGATYKGTTRLASATNAAAAAFTAPAAPSIVATPNTNFTTTVARTYAGWVGGGPTSKASVSRDRGWELERTPLSTTSWAAVGTEVATATKVHSGRTPGTTDRYRARACNASGCGPWSALESALQRPPTPSCSTSAATTRSMVVTMGLPASESAYTAYDVDATHSTATGQGVTGYHYRTIDRLPHNRLHGFTVRSQNASPAGGGWSDTSSCTGSTLLLAASTPTWSATTRTINASFTATRGDDRSIELGNTGRTGTSSSWDPLADDTAFTLTATNSDGFNTVSSSTTARTDRLNPPATPTCGATTTDNTSPGAITISASGSGINQVRLGSSGTWYEQNSRSYGGLGYGTYYGYARSYATDGYNTAFSGTDACAGRTIAETTTRSNAWCAANVGPYLPVLDAVTNEILVSAFREELVNGGSYTPTTGSAPNVSAYITGPNYSVTNGPLIQWKGYCNYERHHTVYDRYGKYFGEFYAAAYYYGGQAHEHTWWGWP